MAQITPYQMAVNNIAAHIRSAKNKVAVLNEPAEAITAITASEILAIAFCKSKEDVIFDILIAP